MNIRELTRDELEELRTNTYYQLDDAEDKEMCKFFKAYNIESIQEITNEMLYDYYAGVTFVNDDFYCNIDVVEVRVTFRKCIYDDDIIAFIEDDITYDDFIQSYQHIGQHSYASIPFYFEDTIPVIEEEYADLLNEIIQVYEGDCSSEERYRVRCISNSMYENFVVVNTLLNHANKVADWICVKEDREKQLEIINAIIKH